MPRKLIPLFVFALILVAAPSASAAEATFRNSAPLSPGDPGSTSSAVNVRNLRGPVYDMEVSLRGVTHPRPQDLDVLLVAPDGRSTVVLSDQCGDEDVSNRTWNIKSGGNHPSFSDVSCPGSYYLPTDGAPFNDFPGVSTGPLSNFHRKVLNGSWRLHVVDDQGGEAGGLTQGWSLTLRTDDVATLLPALGTSGIGGPYPQTENVPAADARVVSDVNVTLPDVSHDRPQDLDLLLVGPRGERAMLMSDACGGSPVETSVTLDDEAAAGLPEGSSDACKGPVKPTDHQPGDALPAPAPAGPHGTSLGAFDGTDPAGEWKLYALDDADGAEGYLRRRFDLQIQTRPKAAVELTEQNVSVAEGGARTVTVRRTLPGNLGEATVQVRSAPGTASATDFTPVAQTVRFGRGEREKTIRIDARADGLGEGPESYAVALSNPTGDAALGARTRLTATIPASAAGAAGGGDVADRLAPALRRLRVDSRRRRLALRVSEPARLRVRIERKRRGRWVRVRSLSRQALRGSNRVSLGRRLRRGRYRVAVIAVDAAGNRSRAVRKPFRVKR